MKRRSFLALGIISLLSAGAWIFYPRAQVVRGSGPLAQQAYIWQRAWTPAVGESAVASAPSFGAYVVLGGEVTFRNRRLEFARVVVDYPALHQTNRPVGIALRIGPYHGSFDGGDATSVQLCDLAASLVEHA